MRSKFSSSSKIHDSSLWLHVSVTTLCILDCGFHAWAPASAVQNPQEQSIMQGHTMTWRSRLELSLTLASIYWCLTVSRFWRAKPLLTTWMSRLQWAHKAY